MARLQDGEREEKENILVRLMRKLRWGARESDLAEELGWERRTVNNYLRQLADDERAEKDGRLWFAKK